MQVARHSLDYVIGFLSFAVFLALAIKISKYLRVIVYLFIVIFFINILTSVSSFIIYNTVFDPQMAYNILATDIEEASSFSNTLILPIVISLFFISIFSISIERLSNELSFNKTTIIFSIIWIFLPLVWLYKEKYDLSVYTKQHPDRLGVRIIKSKTIFYNYYEFLRGYEQLQDVRNILKTPFNSAHLKSLNLSKSIDKIIIIVGESARRQNMSLYGYDRLTTPNQEAEKENMLLYTNAVSPAPFTHQAVPLSLSSIKFDDYAAHRYQDMNDNVVNVADKHGYFPYWITHRISPEERFLSNKAKEIKITGGYYDENLLPSFKTFLQNEKKQLIILHFWGSHADAKNNYPASKKVFKENNHLDSYDNSIAYTDFVLGKVFMVLRNYNAAVIYYSDHGQEYNYGKFFHAQTKNANKVPLYIWYGNKVPLELRKTGLVSDKISTRVVYSKALELMGLVNTAVESVSPPLYLENGKKVQFKNLKDVN